MHLASTYDLIFDTCEVAMMNAAMHQHQLRKLDKIRFRQSQQDSTRILPYRNKTSSTTMAFVEQVSKMGITMVHHPPHGLGLESAVAIPKPQRIHIPIDWLLTGFFFLSRLMQLLYATHPRCPVSRHQFVAPTHMHFHQTNHNHNQF